MTRRLVLLGTLLGALWGTSGAAAQGWDGEPSVLPVPATGTARQSELSLGLAALTPVERLKAETVTDPSGVKVTARIAKKGAGESLLWELRWEPRGPWGTGTWVAFRDGLGRLREVRIILLEGSDGTDHRVAQPGTWVRLVPDGSSCRLDLLLAGRLVTGGWAVPGTLVDVLASSDAWFWETTGSDLDWSALLPQRRWEDEKVEALQARVHKLLSTVPPAPRTLWWPDPKSGPAGTSATGAPWGNWAALGREAGEASRGLGAWGVSLWVSEGILRGWKGEFPSWDSLLEPRTELPGYSRALVPEDPTTEPGFGLDWIRNLGLALHKTLYPNRPRSNTSADVSSLPFLDPVPDAGYAVADLPAVLHLLAVSKPGQAYLATLSVQQAGAKGAPSAVSYREPAVLLPWIGSDQKVRVSVYAGPQEVSWETWISQASGSAGGRRPDHVALVALPLPPVVELPVLPAR